MKRISKYLASISALALIFTLLPVLPTLATSNDSGAFFVQNLVPVKNDNFDQYIFDDGEGHSLYVPKGEVDKLVYTNGDDLYNTDVGEFTAGQNVLMTWGSKFDGNKFCDVKFNYDERTASVAALDDGLNADGVLLGRGYANGKYWEKMDSMSKKRSMHSAFEYEGKLCVLGGFYYDGVSHYLEDMECIEADENEWKPMGSGYSLPVGQGARNMAVWVENGQIHVSGGEAVGKLLVSTWGSGGSNLTLEDGSIYSRFVANGNSSKGYKVANDEEHSPGGYINGGSAVVNGALVHFGGEVFDGSGNLLEYGKLGSYSGRSQFGYTVLDDRIYVFGGYDGTDAYNELLMSEDGVSWSEMSAAGSVVPLPMYRTTLTAYDDELWVVGGAKNPAGSADHYITGYYDDVWRSSTKYMGDMGAAYYVAGGDASSFPVVAAAPAGHSVTENFNEYVGYEEVYDGDENLTELNFYLNFNNQASYVDSINYSQNGNGMTCGAVTPVDPMGYTNAGSMYMYKYHCTPDGTMGAADIDGELQVYAMNKSAIGAGTDTSDFVFNNAFYSGGFSEVRDSSGGECGTGAIFKTSNLDLFGSRYNGQCHAGCVPTESCRGSWPYEVCGLKSSDTSCPNEPARLGSIVLPRDTVLDETVAEETVDTRKMKVRNGDLKKLGRVDVSSGDEEEVVLSLENAIVAGKASITNETGELKFERQGGFSMALDTTSDNGGMEISAASGTWNGELLLPTKKTAPTADVNSLTSGDSIGSAIKVGSEDVGLKLSKSAVVVLPKESATGVAWYNDENAQTTWEYITACPSNVNNLASANAFFDSAVDNPKGLDHCYVESSDAFSIYTKHFSFFATVMSTVANNSSSSSSSSVGTSRNNSSATATLAESVQKTLTGLAGMIGQAGANIYIAGGYKADEVLAVTRGGSEITMQALLDGAVENGAAAGSGLYAFAVGDVISTNNVASAQVDFGGFTRVNLLPDSSMEIAKAEDNKIEYVQKKGGGIYKFEKQGTEMSWEIQTPSVNAVIRGTTIAVNLAEDGSEEYYLIEGKVDMVASNGTTYPIVAGDKFVIDSDGNVSIDQFGNVVTTTVTKEVEKDVDSSFIDVADDAWFKNYVEKLRIAGVVKGYSDGTFRPAGNVTRAEVVKMSMLGAGLAVDEDAVQTSFLFRDTGREDWYSPYVSLARRDGMVDGYNDNTFQPNKPITRAEALKMIISMNDISVSSVVTESEVFSDVDVNAWYAPYVAYAKANEIIGGYDDGTFRPNEAISRAEFAKIAVVANNL